MRISRRNALSAIAMGTLGISYPATLRGEGSNRREKFRYCLNTSTISGKSAGLLKYIEIASKAGYDGIEVWVRDVEDALKAGETLSSLKQFTEDHGIVVENAIGFAPWLAEGNAGLIQMEAEMKMLAGIACRRIAAAPAGLQSNQDMDFLAAGKKYGKLLELGRKTGVMPQLEFWGSSPVLWHLGQVLMIAAAADDPDVKILPDVYHMFRGGSGFDSLKMLRGNLIDVFHMNDYPGNKPRKELGDADRVYPGDGVAPLHQILSDLKNMNGEKVLSLELFNRAYWEEDPLLVARTGLAKMKAQVMKIN